MPEYGARELRAVIANEQVVNLTDVVFRRLPIAVSGRLNRESAAEIAAHAAETLEWSAEECERQTEDLRRVARERHAIDLYDAPSTSIGEGARARFVKTFS